jgi:hypothetical protein
VGALVVALGVGFVCVAVAASDAHVGGGYSSYSRWMNVLAVVWTALWAASTARVDADGPNLVLVDLVTVRRVPASIVSDVSGRNGLVVITRRGHRLASVAYGGSVLQQLVPSARYERAAGDVRTWLLGAVGREPVDGEPGRGTAPSSHRATAASARDEGIERRVRREVGAVLLGALVAGQGLAFVLWSDLGAHLWTVLTA